jgi:hypothetical protein
MTTVQKIITSAIEILTEEQLLDGGFLNTSGYKTTFLVSNILSCVNSCGDEPRLAEVQKKAANFLLQNKSQNYSFNYWARDSVEMKAMPYPDDLDDTFAAFIALYDYDPEIASGSFLASVTKILTAVETAPGGPYRTWLVTEEAKSEWRDVDVVVNANIGCFLSNFGIYMPGVENFLDGRLSDEGVQSPYYPGRIQPLYFLARFYGRIKGGKMSEKMKIAGLIHEERLQNGFWRNTLECAMAISAFFNLGLPELVSREDILFLIESINAGGYKPYPFCLDPVRDGITHYSESRALTAVFVIEALALFEFEDNDNAQKEICLADVARPSNLERIKNTAKLRCENLPIDLREYASEVIDGIDAIEVVELSYAMNVVLGNRNSTDIEIALLDELALANLYGWLAYEIYDGFLDGEGDPRRLPVANVFLRELTMVYIKLDAAIPGIQEMYKKIMNIIDDANFKEQIATAEDWSLEELADRSLGHALPALAVMLMNGYDSDSNAISAIWSFFRYYLAARQLHDDAHDWKEDLERGRITGVVSRLIAFSEEDSDTAIHIIFWREVIPKILKNMQYFLHQARESIRESAIFLDPSPLEAMLARLESAAAHTMRERARAIEFINKFTCYN